MSILKYKEITSPFIQPKALFHLDKFREIERGNIPVPITCEIDLTDGFCNNKCTHCFFGTNQKENPIYMEKSIAKELLYELKSNNVKAIEFTGGGEPTTHVDFNEIADYACSIGLQVGLVTNGLLLDKMKDVAKNFNWIRVSLDAATPDTYKLVHGVDCFEKVLLNIKSMLKVIDGNKFGIGFLIVENNLEDILQATKLVRDMGCRYIQFRPASLAYKVDSSVWYKAHEYVLQALNYSNNSFQVFDAGIKWTHVNEPRYYSKCWTNSLVAVVKASGDMPLCVLNRNNADTYLGNIHNGGFFKHWNSEKHRNIMNNIDIQKCRKPCKHDSYNIAYEAYEKDLYNCNFL